MGIETWPVIEDYVNPEPITVDNFVEWKWLTDCVEHLDEAAKTLNLTPLKGFCNYSRQDAIDAESEEDVEETEAEAESKDGWFQIDEGKLWTPERQWFVPDDALKMVRGLIQLLQTQPDSIESDELNEGDIDGFLYVLPELEKALVKAQQLGRRFYLKSAG